MPVSSFTCTRAAEGSEFTKPGAQATTSIPASTSAWASCRVSAPIASTGPSMPAWRSARASSAVAVASQVAPPSSAARALSRAPWP